MRINRLQNDQGEFRCFEIDNRTISRNGMAKIISQLSGVEVTHYPKFYNDEVFCQFELNGHKFEMTEPYGDSSVYDVVAPEDLQPEMNYIAEHFEKSRPIKGGDFGQRLFFTFNWFLATAIWIGLISAGIWGYNRVFS